jgi:hypothetical protein
MARKSRVLTDHDEIRSWAEERDARPTCVRGTGSEENVGMIRLDFPGYSGETSLEPIEWDDWFQKFEDNNLALVVEVETAEGEQSNFNKIIGRGTAEASASGRKTSRRAQRGAGEKEGGRRSVSSARASSKRGSRSRSGGRRATASRSSRSRSGRSTSARGTSSRSRSSKSRLARTTTGKKRAQGARRSSRSRSRRRAA